MTGWQNKQVLGVVLILIGILFLLVSNHVLLDWSDVWPLFPLLGGIFLLKLYPFRKQSEVLFAGLTFFLIGLFFLVFTFGMLSWEDMANLWPTFPLIAGISLLAVAGTRKHATGSLIVGIAAVLFALVGYLHAGGAISPRVAAPFVRMWPLILIVMGLVVYLRARQEEREPPADTEQTAE